MELTCQSVGSVDVVGMEFIPSGKDAILTTESRRLGAYNFLTVAKACAPSTRGNPHFSRGFVILKPCKRMIGGVLLVFNEPR